MLRRGCIGDIVFFVFNVLIRGGAQAYRHALRGGLLRPVLTTANESVDWSGISDLLCSIVKTLQAYLSLYSVLSPAAHVVHELDRTNTNFHARDQKLHTLKLKAVWTGFRKALSSQRPVLKEYCEEVLNKGPALCSCPTVCYLKKSSSILSKVFIAVSPRQQETFQEMFRLRSGVLLLFQMSKGSMERPQRPLPVTRFVGVFLFSAYMTF